MRSKLLLALAALLGLTLAGAGSVGLSGKSTAHAAAKPRPNVVVIETDDQTVEEMRVMRNTLQLIGAQGTTFDNNFVSLSLCCPSRSTFLTGQYAHNHGVLTNSAPNGGFAKLDHTNTLAVWLQNAGYNTALVGKYLNGYGRKGQETLIPPGWTEFHAGVNLSYLNWTLNDNGTLLRYGSSPGDYQSEVLTTKAVDVINRRVPEAKPLFMWVTYHAPHGGGPAEPDDPKGLGTVRVADKYRNHFAAEPLPNMPSFNETDVSDKPVGIRRRPVLTRQKIAAIREAYQQQLESLLSVDDGVKAIVDALRVTGELDNTVLVFTDDNGFFHGQHRVPSGKVLLYEPSIRVPLLMRGPGVPKNKHLRQMVANIDLAPTIVALAKARAGRVMDGRSLLPILHRPSIQWGRDLLIERGPAGQAKSGAQMGEIGNGDNGNQGKTAAPGDQRFVALRTPRYLYAEYTNGEKELYDLANDPDELTNRALDPAYAAIRTELSARLAKLATCKGPACRVGPSVSLSVSCRRKTLTAGVSGSDARLITSVAFSLNGRLRARDARAPFRARLARPRKPATLDARVAFVDGRVVLRESGCR
jgi:N-acetylglucosamine-6-sulfatase